MSAPFEGMHTSEEISPNLLAGRLAMEMKFLRETPAVFKALMGDFALDPQAFSKYRLAAVSPGLVASLVSAPEDCGYKPMPDFLKTALFDGPPVEPMPLFLRLLISLVLGIVVNAPTPRGIARGVGEDLEPD